MSEDVMNDGLAFEVTHWNCPAFTPHLADFDGRGTEVSFTLRTGRND